VYPRADGIDAVGVNHRRLLIRDDPDGLYVGGALFTDDQATALAGELALILAARAGRARRAGAPHPGGAR
jgi:hypothetical protein